MHARTLPVVSSRAHSFIPGLATYLLSRRSLTIHATQHPNVSELGVRSPSYTAALLQYFKEKPGTPEQGKFCNSGLLSTIWLTKPLEHLMDHIASCPKSGLLRSKAVDNDEEQYWEASSMQLYDMLGQTVSLQWCHDILKASFKWRHNRIGNRCPCSEIPTVRT